MRLDADPTRLAQVVGNLLSNAAQVHREGGRIRLAVERDGERRRGPVRDTGIGIAAEQRARMFDLFTQVDGRWSARRAAWGSA